MIYGPEGPARAAFVPARQAKLRLVKHRVYEKTGILLLEYARV